MAVEVLQKVYKITKRAEDGSVLETKYVEDRWIPPQQREYRPDNNPDLMYVNPPLDYEGETIRTVKDKKVKPKK